MYRRTFLSTIGSAITLGTVGCESRKVRDREGNALIIPSQADDDDGYILVITLDLSGSYQQLMTKDGKAFEFLTNVCDQYLRNRVGTNDEIIIAQLSKTVKPLVWQGTPQDLREEFEDAEDFRRMLIRKSDPAGSRVYDGIADVIDYVTQHPGVPSRQKRVVFLCLSDMDDNASSGPVRMVRSLKTLAQTKSVAGFYWVDQTHVAATKKFLVDAGFRTFVVESEIKSRPPLPVFQE